MRKIVATMNRAKQGCMGSQSGTIELTVLSRGNPSLSALDADNESNNKAVLATSRRGDGDGQSSVKAKSCPRNQKNLTK